MYIYYILLEENASLRVSYFSFQNFASYFVLASPLEPKIESKYRLCMSSVIYCKTTIVYPLKMCNFEAGRCKIFCAQIPGAISKVIKVSLLKD